MQSIESLENQYAGKDIYVIGAGKSCDFIDPEFLNGKIAIGVNQSHRRFKHLKFIVKKDGASQEDLGTGIPVVVSEFRYGGKGVKNETGEFTFGHNYNNPSPIIYTGLHPEGEKLIVSYSTITSAIHFAAFLGAKNIFLIGHDCGSLDGSASFDGYHEGTPNLWASVDKYKGWLGKIQVQTLEVRAYIYKNYNCRIYSISPFIGLNLENHNFEG